ncbi:MAG: response regulator [Lachnospiraceae bacterium]|nr:response regulator [Lachnospiraceae bacterium]
MSHEIRTPINAVLGMDEMILRESNDSQILEYAADIKRAGTTLLWLINDILDFSKIESGKMDIIPVDYDLGTVISDIINMVKPKIEEKNLDLELQIDPATPVHLFGDEIRLRQIIINIMTNAVKYTAKGHVLLTISGQKTGADKVTLYVSVKDTGIGIKDEDKKILFDAFQRVDENRNRNIEGTGLGLSITMCLLQLMESRLQVESVYGEGSDFYFYLEQVQQDDQVMGDFEKNYINMISAVDVYTEQFAAPKVRILVVDDNQMNLKVFTGLLKNSGMKIDTAMSGKECLELMRQQSYHIIFLDHLMPEMDGIEVLKRAKEMKDNLNTNAVMIALTANAVSGAREMFLEQGFNDYLSKPIVASKLEEVLRRYLPDELIVQPLSNKDTLEEQDSQEQSMDETEQSPQKELVDWNKGIRQSMDDKDFYREILTMFLNAHSDEQLNNLYETGDWKNYHIKIHAVKTNLANIAADEASEMAKQLEYALKNNNDIDYIQAHHEEFIQVYYHVRDQVNDYLSGEKSS